MSDYLEFKRYDGDDNEWYERGYAGQVGYEGFVNVDGKLYASKPVWVAKNYTLAVPSFFDEIKRTIENRLRRLIAAESEAK